MPRAKFNVLNSKRNINDRYDMTPTEKPTIK